MKLLVQARSDLSFAIVDAILIFVSYMAAMAVRSLDGLVPNRWWVSVLSVMPVIIVVHLISNVLMGTYGHVWEYASIGEARRVVAATFFASSFLVVATLAIGTRPVPLSVLAAGGLLSLFCMGAVRFRSRLFSFHRTLGLAEPSRALIIGTGKQAAALAREIAQSPNGVTIVGFVSPQDSRDSRRLAGLPILGQLDEIASLVDEYGIDQVIVAATGASSLARRLVDLCVDVDVRLRIVPDFGEVLEGNGGGLDIRDLELDDLLLRPKVSTEIESVASLLSGKRVLVTGAGGSIGSEIVAQVLQFGPEQLVALDNDETHLHEGILRWEADDDVELIAALGDIKDREQLRSLVAEHKPQVVFHAAAHKHVPILEQWPEEAVKTNVIGTANLLEEVDGPELEAFVLISTDKTVEPSGVMGASKRVAEMLVQHAVDTRDHTDSAFASVRFGNVLGSRGSVVPTFIEQIENGGPVTITDERMTRYFMTITEAVELVLQAGAMARDGEVFVLDMGQPVRIVDLAHRMIRLYGLVPGRDIAVEISGIRPGEKLEETLAAGSLVSSSHEKINIAQADELSAADLHHAVGELQRLAEAGDSESVRDLLLAVANDRWEPEEVSIDLTALEANGNSAAPSQDLSSPDRVDQVVTERA